MSAGYLLINLYLFSPGFLPETIEVKISLDKEF